MKRDNYSGYRDNQNDKKTYDDAGIYRYLVSGAEKKAKPFKWKRYVALLLLAFALMFTLVTGGVTMYYAGLIIRPSLVPVVPIRQNIAAQYSSVSFRSADDAAVVLQGWHFHAPIPSEEPQIATIENIAVNMSGNGSSTITSSLPSFSAAVSKTAATISTSVSSAQSRKVVIIAHGFGSNRFPFGSDTLELVARLGREGYAIITFDMRNSGGQEPGISTFGIREKDDVLGAITYARNQGYQEIVLLGVSTGANAAALAAAADGSPDITALILDSPVVDVGKFIMHKIREINPDLPDFPFRYEAPAMTALFLNADPLSANIGVNLNQFVPRPVLIIHGSNDEITSRTEISEVYNSYLSLAVGRASLLEIPGVTHADCFSQPSRDEYLNRVAAFLERI